MNAWFLYTVRTNKELQTMEYVLITIQCSFDLILTGILGLVHYMLDLIGTVLGFCVYGGFLDHIYTFSVTMS